MEEIHSTEVLDREILEDARKKAFKILKNADDAIAAKKAAWETKTRDDLAAVKKSYEEKSLRFRDESFARLPLDKRRIHSRSTEAALLAAKEEYLKNADKKTLLKILKDDLRAAVDSVPELKLTEKGAALECEYAGMEEGEFRALLADCGFSAAPQIKAEKNARGKYLLPAVVISSPDAIIRVSAEEKAEEILQTHRAELVSALFGEGALNG